MRGKYGELARKTCLNFMKEPLLVAGAAALSVFVTAITLGLMGLVMFAGMAEIFRKLDKDEKISINDVFFKSGKTFVLFVLGLIIGLCAGIGFVLLIVPGLIVAALWIFAPYHVAFEGLSIKEALGKSYSRVMGEGVWKHVVIITMLLLLNIAGANIFLAGLLLTHPFTAGFLYYLYKEG